MSVLVTARVPEEIRRQGNALLKEIGSTPTELINAAYRYLIDVGRLPAKPTGVVRADREDAATVRGLDAAQMHALVRSIECTTVQTSGDPLGGASYKALVAEGRASDYEALP